MAISDNLNVPLFMKSPRSEAEALMWKYVDSETSSSPQYAQFKKALFDRGMKFYDDFHARIIVTRPMYRAERNPNWSSLSKYFGPIMRFMREKQGKPKPPARVATKPAAMVPGKEEINAQQFFDAPRDVALDKMQKYIALKVPGRSRYRNNQEPLVSRGMKFYDDYHSGIRSSTAMYEAELAPAIDALMYYFGPLMRYSREKLGRAPAVPCRLGIPKELPLVNAKVSVKPEEVSVKPEEVSVKVSKNSSENLIVLNIEEFFKSDKKNARKALKNYLDQPLLNGTRSGKFKEQKVKLLLTGMTLHAWYQKGYPCSLNLFSKTFGINLRSLKKHLGSLMDSNFWQEQALAARNSSRLDPKKLNGLAKSKAALRIRDHVYKKIGTTLFTSDYREKLINVGLAIYADSQAEKLNYLSVYDRQIGSTPNTIKIYFGEFFPVFKGYGDSGSTVRTRRFDSLKKLGECITHRKLSKPSCLCCKTETWQNRPFHEFGVVDHIDGNSQNQDPDNLRPVCASCHASTVTFCNNVILPVEKGSDPSTANMVRTEKQYAKKAAKRLYYIERQKTSPTFFHATVEDIQRGKHPRLRGNSIIPRFIAAGLKSECCEA
uniref:HNH nuclease domain-containing protein n=1 Tax=Chaetophora lobata TaxID=1249516 RepID=A0A7U1G3A4_9CHLO|nr:hypothetical protein [Chaetophora lobata]